MPKGKQLIIITEYADEPSFSLEELSEKCGVSNEFIQTLIEYEIIHPIDFSKKPWRFDITQLQQVKSALRLQHDLGVNIAGIALVMDLLREREDLLAMAKLLEKHFFRF